MTWTVSFHTEFEPEFFELAREVQDEVFAQAKLLEKLAPILGVPGSIR